VGREALSMAVCTGEISGNGIEERERRKKGHFLKYNLLGHISFMCSCYVIYFM
jgi:hypothetical protein